MASVLYYKRCIVHHIAQLVRVAIRLLEDQHNQTMQIKTVFAYIYIYIYIYKLILLLNYYFTM
jgi:hypothetical protein